MNVTQEFTPGLTVTKDEIMCHQPLVNNKKKSQKIRMMLLEKRNRCLYIQQEKYLLRSREQSGNHARKCEKRQPKFQLMCLILCAIYCAFFY